MARKEKGQTTGEKPITTLVPEAEQPYPAPGNWCWVRLGDVANIVMGQSPKGEATTDDPSYTPLIGGAADMGKRCPKASRYTKIPTKLSSDRDVILCIRATLGHPIYSDGVYCLGRGVAAVRSDCLMREFIRYGFINFEQYLYNHATGTTFAQVSSNVLKKMPFPLPPLPEQKRIVDLIEDLFADLDAAKEKLTAVLDGFAQRKAAILHRAFTGELTAEWRKERGVDLSSWKDCQIEDIFVMKAGKNISAKKISPVQDAENHYRCYGGNGLRGYVDTFNEEGEFPLVGRQGALCGNVHKASGRFYATEHAVVVKNKMPMDVDFAVRYLKFLNLNQYATATAQPGLAVSKLMKVPVRYVPIPEQKEIARILDEIFKKEQQAQAAVEEVLEGIDTLKKSILARAFRGELGTGSPTDESATGLLG